MATDKQVVGARTSLMRLVAILPTGYSPPSGSGLLFNFTDGTYVAPTGSAVNFDFGGGAGGATGATSTGFFLLL